MTMLSVILDQVEALVLNDRFAALLTDVELDLARRRLDEARPVAAP